MSPRAIQRSDAVLAVLVAAIAIATFAPALAGGFVHDDHRQIESNPMLRDVPALFTTGVWAGAGSGSSWYRPLMMASFAVDRALFGPSAAAAHAVSLVLFAATAAFAFGAARVIARPPRVPRTAVQPMAFGAAVLGAVHPIQAEAAAWISARCELLAAAFGLLALIQYDRMLRTKTSMRQRGVALLFALALFSKESAIALVPAFFALDRIRGAGHSPRELLDRHGAWLLVLLLYAFARGHALGDVGGGIAGTIDPKALVGFFGQGALRIAVPHALTISPPTPTGADVWAGAVLALAIAAASLAAWRARSTLLVPIVLGASFLAIGALGAARLGEVADRYLVLPAFAAAWLACAGVAALPMPARRVGFAAVGAIALGFAIASTTHVRVYATDESLWTDAFAKNPRSVRAALNLGAVHLDRREPHPALEWLDRAAVLAPGDPEVELDRAVAAEQLGDTAQARARLDALADANPGYWPAALRAGHLALDAHDWPAAGARYESVLRVHPLSAEAWAGLGVVREREGRHDDARRALERSLALDPDQDNAAALRAMLGRLGS